MHKMIPVNGNSFTESCSAEATELFKGDSQSKSWIKKQHTQLELSQNWNKDFPEDIHVLG